MTLIIALKCKDGVILGSDTEQTRMILGGIGVKDKKKRKVKVIGSCAIMGCAGDVDFIQKVEKQCDMINERLSSTSSIDDLTGTIKGIVFSIRKADIERDSGLYPFRIGTTLSEMGIILIGHRNGEPTITVIDSNAKDIEIDDKVAIGIGEPFAEVILKQHYTEDLDLDKALFLVYRAIALTESTGVQGVGSPIQLWTITGHGSKIKIQPVDDGIIKALDSSNKSVEQILGDVFSGFNLKSGTLN
ncbi:hypothetical protein KAU34_07285 [candidate division WOR-3 bacterium]|nr:hypothetical protein [candidate division WOR-3 bacterium]